MLRHAVSAPRSIAVAVLDVAKAFDSVNHDTLLRAAVAHAAPPLLLNLLSSSYARTTTHIFDTEVRCLRGVRQGDPLSPPSSFPVLYLKLFPILIGSLASSWME
ncbi:hypothetical protein AAHC03_019521 [Spirometra sp. Aus1]